MNDQKRQRLADEAAEDALRAANHLGEQFDGVSVLDRMRSQMLGVGAQSFDVTSRGGVSRPTENAALSPRTDNAAKDLAQLDHLLRVLSENASALVRLLANYKPREATSLEKQRIAAELANRQDPGCESCSRLTRQDGKGKRWEPPLTKEPSRVGNRLKNPMLLCRFCSDEVRAYGEIPSVSRLRDYHNGKLKRERAS